jgi:hypothetical protein
MASTTAGPFLSSVWYLCNSKPLLSAQLAAASIMRSQTRTLMLKRPAAYILIRSIVPSEARQTSGHASDVSTGGTENNQTYWWTSCGRVVSARGNTWNFWHQPLRTLMFEGAYPPPHQTLEPAHHTSVTAPACDACVPTFIECGCGIWNLNWVRSLAANSCPAAAAHHVM